MKVKLNFAFIVQTVFLVVKFLHIAQNIIQNEISYSEMTLNTSEKPKILLISQTF
jgi:hypothetical protein